MHGRRSLHLDLLPIDLELERTLRAQRASHRHLNTMAEDEGLPPPLKTYFTPNAYTSPSCIWIPTTVAHYEINPRIVSMLTPFFGLPSEDPYKHINQFLKVCSTVKLNNLTEETLRLILFPFSLKDRAEYWLNSRKANSITSWQ